jgi:NADH:ubiquinone oxidoreductase subunit 3 (subunit A)
MAEITPESYIPLALFALLGLLFALISLYMPRFFAPRSAHPRKSLPFECGEEPLDAPPVQFHFQYYRYAIPFVVSDVMALFILLYLSVWRVAGVDTRLVFFTFVVVWLVAISYALKMEEKIWI